MPDLRGERDARIHTLVNRLDKVVRDAGRRVASVWPIGDGQAFTTYMADIKSSLTGSDVALVTCTDRFRSMFTDETAWMRCGMFFIADGFIHRISLGDIDFEIASTRVLLNRGVDEVTECTICCDRRMAFACRKCWTSCCRECFAKCSLHATDRRIWTCPQCRSHGPIGDVIKILEHDRRPLATNRAFDAIRRGMAELGVATTRVTVEASLPVRGGHARRDDKENGVGGKGVQNYRRSFRVKMSPRGYVVIEGDDSRFLTRLMHEPYADIVLGDIPHEHERPGRGLEGDIINFGGDDSGDGGEKCGGNGDGRVYYVDKKGSVIERIDMFGCMAAYVRAWSA
jgi:hypothetical protein